MLLALLIFIEVINLNLNSFIKQKFSFSDTLHTYLVYTHVLVFRLVNRIKNIKLVYRYNFEHPI